MAPLTLKGKREPVAAYRVLAVRPTVARRAETRLVGRRNELRLLAEARTRGVRRLTLVGEAGVGKSRLAAEFVNGLRAAAVLQGRCLSYGEGVTYAPVVEALASVDVRGNEVIRALRGESDASFTAEEAATAVREALASLRRAVVVVFEDVHWGQPTFLDLGDQLATAHTRIFILCLARPELLERRPEWSDELIRLDALSDEESTLLVEQLADLAPDVRARIIATAEGNPLFLEELVAFAQEGGAVTVPPTIHVVLAARLDQLDPVDRSVLQRAAVQGKEFELEAIEDASLDSLLDANLVRPSARGYQFRPQLIHDAAYESLPNRGDPSAAVDLLGRALALLPAEAQPPALERMYWSILYASGRTDEVQELVDAAAAAAAAAGDRERELHARQWLDAFGSRRVR